MYCPFSEETFKETQETINEGNLIKGTVVNNLKCADDTILLADSEEQLQVLVDRIPQFCNKCGMETQQNYECQ